MGILSDIRKTNPQKKMDQVEVDQVKVDHVKQTDMPVEFDLLAGINLPSVVHTTAVPRAFIQAIYEPPGFRPDDPGGYFFAGNPTLTERKRMIDDFKVYDRIDARNSRQQCGADGEVDLFS